jgi:hypothetical protein
MKDLRINIPKRTVKKYIIDLRSTSTRAIFTTVNTVRMNVAFIEKNVLDRGSTTSTRAI